MFLLLRGKIFYRNISFFIKLCLPLKFTFVFSVLKNWGKTLTCFVNLRQSFTCKHCRRAISKDNLLRNLQMCIYLYTILFQARNLLCSYSNRFWFPSYAQVPLFLNEGGLQAGVLQEPFSWGLFYCSVLFWFAHLLSVDEISPRAGVTLFSVRWVQLSVFCWLPVSVIHGNWIFTTILQTELEDRKCFSCLC